MHHQMIDLDHSCGPVLFGLIRILDPQLVQNANCRIVLELPVQIVSHLSFCYGPSALARVS